MEKASFLVPLCAAGPSLKPLPRALPGGGGAAVSWGGVWGSPGGFMRAAGAGGGGCLLERQVVNVAEVSCVRRHGGDCCLLR